MTDTAGVDASEPLVVGEALMDVIPGDADGVRVRVPGGSPANVAAGLGRLGVRTRLLTHIADDADGRAIQANLRDSGVAIEPGSWSAEVTPTAEASLRSDGSAAYRFNVTWELPAQNDVAVGSLLHVGSYSSVRSPGHDGVRELVERHVDAGRPVSVDANVRPVLFPPAAEARARLHWIFRRAAIVKLSDEDARWLYPRWSLTDVLQSYIAMGASVALLTLGAEGALAATPRKITHVPAVPTRVVDTVGAGDSFMAAFLRHVRIRPETLRDHDLALAATKSAVRAASITVGRKGADLPVARELRT